jgi:hypothetical protein
LLKRELDTSNTFYISASLFQRNKETGRWGNGLFVWIAKLDQEKGIKNKSCHQPSSKFMLP